MSRNRQKKGGGLQGNPKTLRNSSSNPVQEHTKSISSNEHSQERQSKSDILVRSELNIPPSIIDRYDADQKEKYRLERWKFRVEILTLIGIFCAAAVALYQWRAMVESNYINREALISVQRAFVSFKTIKAVGIKDNNERITDWRFSIIWENTGATPTRFLRQHVNMYGPVKLLPSNFSFSDRGPSENRIALIAAKATTSVNFPPVPLVSLSKIKKGEYHLYFWGWASYRDIFEDSKAHLTKFCYELTEVSEDILKGKKGKFNFSICSTHNCIDKNCPDYDQTEERLQKK